MKKISLSLCVSTLLGTSLLANSTIDIKNGWGIYGIDGGISNVNDFFQNYSSDVNLVWAFDSTTNRWKAFSPNSNLTTLISQNADIDNLTSISQYEGFWIKSNNQFNISMPDTTSSSSTVISCDASTSPLTNFTVNPTIANNMFENTIISYSGTTATEVTKYLLFPNGKAYYSGSTASSMGLLDANWTISNNQINVSYIDGVSTQLKLIEVEVLNENNNSSIMNFIDTWMSANFRKEVIIENLGSTISSPTITTSLFENKVISYDTDSMNNKEIFEFYTNGEGSIFNYMTNGFKDTNWTITANNDINISYSEASIIYSKLFKVEQISSKNDVAILNFIDTSGINNNIKRGVDMEALDTLPTLTTTIFENKSISYDSKTYDFYPNGKGFLNESLSLKDITWNIVDNNLTVLTDMGTTVIDFSRLYKESAILNVDSMIKTATIKDLDSNVIIQPALTTSILNNRKLVFGGSADTYEYLFLENGIVYFKGSTAPTKATWAINNHEITIDIPDMTDIVISIELLNNNIGKLKDSMNNIIDFKLDNISYEDIQELYNTTM